MIEDVSRKFDGFEYLDLQKTKQVVANQGNRVFNDHRRHEIE